VHAVEIAVVMQSKDINVVVASKLAYPGIKVVYYQQMQSTVDKRDALHTWMYSKLSLWISLTNRMKTEVLAHTRVPEHLVKVVPLGRDTHVFDPRRYDQVLMRRRFGLPVDRTIVAMLGRLDPQKGLEEFVRSLHDVSVRHPGVLYLIAGDETLGEPGYRRYLDQLVEQLGLGESVRFLPFTDAVPEFMAAIDLFILPSYSETFGLALIEAMAMEKPVVATRAGGVPEIVENGRDGLLIPPRDEKSLADAINLLLDDPSLRNTLSRRARQDVIRRFDSNRCVDQLVHSLDSL
jgi:glycosyltransferase involved in cell wall biosynthesis